MTHSDDESVQALALAMHVVECLPGAHPYHQYSAGHRQVHERRAGLVLAELAKAGHSFATHSAVGLQLEIPDV
ncbi:hypothetical protein FHR83_006654 [Actinoplanes campanulatus]|uniref:Uncharacterized protein n=1 Tax=Actinoplanes campanulatus TaxID=113559 RepID=A0A7W5FHR9_9ACTN|nr:hypothetical protein [Actinoplanes campanulatus]MBB3098948.1 hypothetical protein [Actinoplanes campanulatus]GGN39723.1 hypothetical protein GCM10010109_68020 [Actinoplanes campanulatus]